MTDAPPSPRFICKSILRMEGGWLVAFPDYESAGENPYSVREAKRLLESDELLEWVKRRIILIGGRASTRDLQEIITVPPPPEKPTLTATGARIRTGPKFKKLKCGHLHPRRKGVYPRRCTECVIAFHERVKFMRRRML